MSSDDCHRNCQLKQVDDRSKQQHLNPMNMASRCVLVPAFTNKTSHLINTPCTGIILQLSKSVPFIHSGTHVYTTAYGCTNYFIARHVEWWTQRKVTRSTKKTVCLHGIITSLSTWLQHSSLCFANASRLHSPFSPSLSSNLLRSGFLVQFHLVSLHLCG